MLLTVEHLVKRYRAPDGSEQVILDIPHFAINAGEQVALAGESGSGKTTFLHCIAGILRPTSGRVLFDGVDIAALAEDRRDAFRARSIGYVFQTFQLLPGLTALENVLLGMLFGVGPDRKLATRLLEEVGLGGRLNHRPEQLSVGQQQRVALARALASRPKLVLADEPTGNLDAPRAREALALLKSSCRDHGAALLVVSHDPAVLAEFARVEKLTIQNRAMASAPGAPS